jgi:hypothetical protein
LTDFCTVTQLVSRPAQPALIDIETAARCRLFGDGVLRLAFGADKKHDLPLRRQVLHKLGRLFEHLQRFLQIDNVNSVALAEDVFLHPRIPALGLVPEVNSRFEQLLHGDISQLTSSFSLHQEFKVSGLQGCKVSKLTKPVATFSLKP